MATLGPGLYNRTYWKLDVCILQQAAQEHLAIRPRPIRTLERVFRIDDHETRALKNPGGKTTVMAMLNPESNLERVNGRHSVQFAMNSRRLVSMDGVETDSKRRQLAIAADVITWIAKWLSHDARCKIEAPVGRRSEAGLLSISVFCNYLTCLGLQGLCFRLLGGEWAAGRSAPNTNCYLHGQACICQIRLDSEPGVKERIANDYRDMRCLGW